MRANQNASPNEEGLGGAAGARHLLLVHGSNHGAWVWHRLERELTHVGLKCTTPDLPGHSRDGSLGKIFHIEDYINAVVDAARRLGLPLDLVVHSLSGVLVPGLISRLEPFVSSVIYLAAMVLPSGVAPAEAMSTSVIDMLSNLLADDPAATFERPKEENRQRYFSDLHRYEQDKYLSLLCPEPVQPLFEVPPSWDARERPPIAYIEFEDDRALRPQDRRIFIEQARPQRHVAIACGHDGMLSSPTALQEAIVSVLREFGSTR